MSKLIFKLTSVPEEEAVGVRKELESAGIEYYETSGGSWGWSLPGLWVKNNSDYLQARRIIEQFQHIYVSNILEATPMSRRGGDKLLFFVLIIMIVSAVAYGWTNEWF